MRKLSTQEFIEKARIVHGDTYDYSAVEYQTTDTKVTIICRVHGPFTQTPESHLNNRGCPVCGRNRTANSKKNTQESFIRRANDVHCGAYDYSKVVYSKYNQKITIICKEHGEFTQAPSSHLYGYGCPSCGIVKSANLRKNTQESFICMANTVHNNKYSYSKVEYRRSIDKVIITCKYHGDFAQTPGMHLQGSGCPHCKNEQTYSKGHLFVKKWMDSNNIKYEEEKTLPGMIYKRKLRFDFYVSKGNIAIEYQGEQHYIKRTQWDKDGTEFAINKERDEIKRKYCSDNGISLIEIPYWFSVVEIDRLLTEVLL